MALLDQDVSDGAGHGVADSFERPFRGAFATEHPVRAQHVRLNRPIGLIQRQIATAMVGRRFRLPLQAGTGWSWAHT